MLSTPRYPSPTHPAGEITGKVQDAQGGPIAHGAVRLLDPLRLVDWTYVEHDGSFRLATTKTGLFAIQFAGANYEPLNSVLYVDKPAKMAITAVLAPRQYVPGERLSLRGVDSSFFLLNGQKLAEQPDGSFEVKLTHGGRVTYCVSDWSGTQSSNYRVIWFRSGGQLCSIVEPRDGEVSITFDPARLPARSGTAEVRFADPQRQHLNEICRESVALTRTRRTERSEAYERYIKEGKPESSFQFHLRPPEPAEIDACRARISREKDPIDKQALWLRCLDLILGPSFAQLPPLTAASAAITAAALTDLTPASPFWLLRPELLQRALTGADQAEKFSSYGLAVVDHASDPAARQELLSILISEASDLKRDDQLRSYLNRLSREFPDADITKSLNQRYAKQVQRSQ